MSLHKLTAGDGYTYLTRQVAAQDATHRGYDGLGEYYAEHGESPGVWLGRGLVGLSEFDGGPVSEAQMRALFGRGLHPDAEQMAAGMRADGSDETAVRQATRLGAPYRVTSEASPFRRQLSDRLAEHNKAAGRPAGAPVPQDVRARIRTELGTEFFLAEHGRPPTDARELSGLLARHSRQATTAVAGYDLTFTPVKTVSVLWALTGPEQARLIQDCHEQVVAETVGWLEDTAALTRLGRNGVRQVDASGVLAAAFTHRDSRAGDPNLHTHVAVSNKVQVAFGAQAGQWRALDGRPLHKTAVAASERYNTRLEALLTERLGVRFAERPAEPGKRAVREIVGVDSRLTALWSSRRASINSRREELSARFQAEHGRLPGPVEAVKLAQQATLETRQAKHEPCSHGEQRATWRAEAVRALGGDTALAAMLGGLPTGPAPRAVPTEAWVQQAAVTVLANVQADRACWQDAHLRAEAERQARRGGLRPADLDPTVEQVVVTAAALSVPLGSPDPIVEPAALRRSDGISVYVPVGTQLFTSAGVLEAEQALLAAAGRNDGRRVTAQTVREGLAARQRVTLNLDQTTMVTELLTSGRRVQLTLAPAGTGKTTALAALADVWTADGGSVVALAPSAAAAAVLGAELDPTGAVPADTLAKLVWSLDTLDQQVRGGDTSTRGVVPGWVREIGPRTLLIVDEAGMAGTAPLAQAVSYVLGRGGSVRLVGDDGQLAAIGAGGVLRDLARTHGAVTLGHVVRFADPAEGAASLALRAGERASLGFYLDHGRVHVGDAGSVVEQAYAAWAADRTAGRDALLLAPTRELARELNLRARHARLDTAGGGDLEMTLADGSAASVGDTIVTRRNERRLVTGATDWVKNGDRWTVIAVLSDGALRVRQVGTGRRVTLPAAYTKHHVALGYASTVHAAQGSTAQVCHTVASGAESRQQLYVGMTRGRTANHLYLTSVGDGDEHSLVTPDAVLPPTAVDLLVRILDRDGAQRSASTEQQTLQDPAGRLAAACDRYADSLSVAVRSIATGNLAGDAERAFAGVTLQPAWPALHDQLALLSLNHDPVVLLRRAVGLGGLEDARDPAAVLSWRLPTPDQGPLPWLPAIPAVLVDHPAWGRYLARRDEQTRALSDDVTRTSAAWTPTDAPAWARPLLDRLDDGLLAQLAVFRAAMAVPDSDLRPTGPPRQPVADRRSHQRLDARVLDALGAPYVASRRWRDLVGPQVLADPTWPQLAGRLSQADRAGLDVRELVQTALALRPLPDELPAAALWWRVARHLPATLPAAPFARVEDGRRPDWIPALEELVGPAATSRMLGDPAWPALVASVDAARVYGWPEARTVVETAYGLLGHDHHGLDGLALPVNELTSALVWRVSMLTEGPPAAAETANCMDPDDIDSDRPDDLHDDDAPEDVGRQLLRDPSSPAVPAVENQAPARGNEAVDVSAAATPMRGARPTAPAGAADWLLHHPGSPGNAAGQTRLWSPEDIVAPQRLLQLNAAARDFYASAYDGSWAASHLQWRLGSDLAADDRFTPGYAPAGWTYLTDHLRTQGATDPELLAAGLVSQTRSGRLIDRFRDRLVLPIHGPDGSVLGFVARRHPDAFSDTAGPKYLNTPGTAVYRKGTQLYGLAEAADLLRDGATPVLAEGPIDALAVTLQGEGEFVGIAPLGTAFTDAQADSLCPHLHPARGVIVATDADAAGRKAAEHAYWQLVERGDAPRHAQLPEGCDPASLLQERGPTALTGVLRNAPSLATTLVQARIDQVAHKLHEVEASVGAMRSAATVIGALPPALWLEHITDLEARLHLTPDECHEAVLEAGHAWTLRHSVLAQTHSALNCLSTVRDDSQPVARGDGNTQSPPESGDNWPAPPARRRLSSPRPPARSERLTLVSEEVAATRPR